MLVRKDINPIINHTLPLIIFFAAVPGELAEQHCIQLARQTTHRAVLNTCLHDRPWSSRYCNWRPLRCLSRTSGFSFPFVAFKGGAWEPVSIARVRSSSSPASPLYASRSKHRRRRLQCGHPNVGATTLASQRTVEDVLSYTIT